jgi:hypothetical protein
MKTIDIHKAKPQLTRLVDRVSAVAAQAEHQRLGFLKGQIEVPDDFDRMGETESAVLFGTMLEAAT